MGQLRGPATALVALALPTVCAGCGAREIAWCLRCAAELTAAAARPWSPTPAPEAMPPTWTALPYAGAVRHTVVAWKDQGRRDLTRVLARPLRTVLAAALEGELSTRVRRGEQVLVVPAPSARRTVRHRGGQPLRDLLATALPPTSARAGVRCEPVLELTRAVADQALLDRAHRAANLDHAMLVPRTRAAEVAGRGCLLVDDVVTTGSTLAEAARALTAAGAAHVVAATVAATPRRTAHPVVDRGAFDEVPRAQRGY